MRLIFFSGTFARSVQYGIQFVWKLTFFSPAGYGNCDTNCRLYSCLEGVRQRSMLGEADYWKNPRCTQSPLPPSSTPFHPLPALSLTSTPFQPQANPLSMYPTLFFRSSSSGLILLLISLQSNDKYSNSGRNFFYHPFRFIDNQSKNSPWDVQCHPLTFTETKSLSVPFLNCTTGKAQSEPSRLG